MNTSLIEADGSRISYFRGRKLHGKTVTLPDEYYGLVVELAAEENERPNNALQDDEEEDSHGPDTATMKATAEFDKVIVWGHESLADSHEDPFVRSMEEWLQVADKVGSAKS